MPASVLIPPDNRLLGWSLADMTLYGGQPTADMAIGRASDGDPTSIAALANGSSGPAATPPASEGDLATQETTALLDRTGEQPPMPSAAPIATPLGSSAPLGTDAQPASPQPIGSSSPPTPPVATPLQAATGDQTPADTAGTLVPGPADNAPVAMAAVADALPLVQLANAGPLAPVADVLSLTQDAIANPIGTIDTVVPDLGVPDLIGPIAADGVELGNAALDTAALAVGPLPSFGGSDPAAGLQTLIGMVESEDMFDLGQSVAPASVDLPGAGSILDALAADAALSPLLGDDGAAGDLLPDDHGIHAGL